MPRKIIGYVVLALCAVFFLYYFGVMIYKITAHAKVGAMVSRFMAEFGFLCLLSLVGFDLRFGLFSWNKNKILKVLGWILRVVSCVFFVGFISLSLTVIVFGAKTSDKTPNTVCVLGLVLNDGQIQKDLVYRLQQTLDYNASYPDTVFIATGGNSEDPEFSEAAVMVKYLRSHGFIGSDDKLIAETNAKTTVENFKYVAEMVDKTSSLGVITNNHHMFRATHIAKKQGFTNIVNIPAPATPSLYMENVTWESICVIFETLSGHLAF